jgi:hypothetical protein
VSLVVNGGVSFLGTLMRIFRLKIVLTVLVRLRLSVSCVSLRKRAWRKRCTRARFKLDIDDKVIQAGGFDNKSTQEEQEEFLVSICMIDFFSSFLIVGFSQRSILEADQEEENKEAGDMNDDELK